MRLAIVTAVSLWVVLARPCYADPCEAIPDRGPLPAMLNFGSTFSGPVSYVIDGDSLCVAVGEGHANWVEVRLADFYAPESGSPQGPAAKAALERIALGQTAVCVANLRTYDRIAARCRVGGRPIGDLMRSAGISEGGNGMERHQSYVARPSRTQAPTPSGLYKLCGRPRRWRCSSPQGQPRL